MTPSFNFPSTFDAPLPKPIEIKRLKRTPEYIFDHSIAGFLIKLLSASELPMSLADIKQEILPVLPNLRKVDGNYYKGDLDKIIRGALGAVDCFRMEGEHWTVDPMSAQAYRDHSVQQVTRRTTRSRVDLVLPERGRKNRIDRIVQMLDKFVLSMHKDPSMKAAFSNPFARFTGEEDLLTACNKLGRERLIGVLQGFELVKQYFDNLKKESNYSNFDGLLRNIFERLERLETRLSNALS